MTEIKPQVDAVKLSIPDATQKQIKEFMGKPIVKETIDSVIEAEKNEELLNHQTKVNIINAWRFRQRKLELEEIKKKSD